MALAFMKYEGITGESQVLGKSGFIELQSVQWSAARPAGSSSGSAGRGDREVQFNDVTVTRQSDSVSALLAAEVMTGKFDRKVDIDFVRTGPNNKAIAFMRVKLEECGISSFSFDNGSGGDIPHETMTLNFRKITFESMQVTDALNAVPFTTSFNLNTGAP